MGKMTIRIWLLVAVVIVTVLGYLEFVHPRNDVVHASSVFQYVARTNTNSPEHPPRLGDKTSSWADNMLCGINMNDILDQTLHPVVENTRLPFLDEYKNPCWLERLPTDYYQLYHAARYFKERRPTVRAIKEVFDERLQRASSSWRLRCLPYFYLAGVTKCGTTDFYSALLRHPELHGGWVKEPMYWNRARYPNGTTVHKRDGSSYLFWEDNGWTNNPGNAGLTEPLYTTPLTIASLTPQARIIVLLRHPTDRLFSAFNMYASEMSLDDSSPEAFHQMAQQCLFLMTTCFQRHGIRACAYNATLSRICHPVSLRGSLYSVFLKDWLAAFPRDQVLVVRAEDYYQNRTTALDETYQFLGTGPLTFMDAQNVLRRSPKNQRSYLPMLNPTRTMLDDFFRPGVQELETLLERRMWEL